MDALGGLSFTVVILIFIVSVIYSTFMIVFPIIIVVRLGRIMRSLEKIENKYIWGEAENQGQKADF